MDLYDIDLKPVNSDFLRELVQKGQKVTIVRMVTIEYKLDKSDIENILLEWDNEDVSVEEFISDEKDNNSISVRADNVDEVDIVDDIVIAVEIS